MRCRRILFLWLLSLFCCKTDRPGVPSPALPGAQVRDPFAGMTEEPETATPDQDRTIDIKNVEPNFQGALFTINPELPKGERPIIVKKAEVTPASPEETAALFARLPALPEVEEKRFARRKETAKKPLTGETIKTRFPPDKDLKRPTAQIPSLKIVRVQPRGTVESAPHLSITFNQPMVSIARADASVTPPVQLTPQPKIGQWRWVGTQTLLFEPHPRFPMATKYNLRLPAKTKSAVGGQVLEDQTFSFETPPPKLVQFQPTEGPVNLSPMMVAVFDQTVDPAQVLTRIRARTTKKIAIRLATSEEIKKSNHKNLVYPPKGDESPRSDRAVAFVAEQPLPKNTKVTVTIGPKVPSAEGPRISEEKHRSSFRTYGKLKVVGHSCNWGGQCLPSAELVIELSNPLDVDELKPFVTIKPKIPQLVMEDYGSEIVLRGAMQVGKTYRVTLKKTLKDTFGNTLGRDTTVRFSIVKPKRGKLLVSQGSLMVLLEPQANEENARNKPGTGGLRYPIYSVNYPALRVRMYTVQPSQWQAFLAWRDADPDERPKHPPGKKVVDRKLILKGKKGDLVETFLDLSPALDKNGVGNLILDVIPPKRYRKKGGWREEEHHIQQWLQVTPLGIDARYDHEQLHVWTNRLKDGATESEVNVSILPVGPSGVTNKTGEVSLSLLESGDTGSILLARKGDTTAFLPESESAQNNSGWTKSEPYSSVRFFVFDDRKIYRPTERVHIKGWIRQSIPVQTGDIVRINQPLELSYIAVDSQNEEISKGQTKFTEQGGFDLSFELPENANLGQATLRLEIGPKAKRPGSAERQSVTLDPAVSVGRPKLSIGGTTHHFRIEEFRRPEFEVSAHTSTGPHLVGEFGTFTVQASYYAGGPLVAADAKWGFNIRSGWYAPPGHEEYTFGTWQPWWRGASQRAQIHLAQTGKTNVEGEHTVRFDFQGANPPRPHVVSADVSVMDLNRQAWTASTQLLVHPADVYVGLKTEQLFLEVGQPIEVESLRVDLDGKPMPGPIEIWSTVFHDDEETSVTCTPLEGRCTFETKVPGTYEITAKTKDERGRPNASTVSVYVTGSTKRRYREEKEHMVELIPDKAEYRDGETAKILVRPPFVPAEGLLSIERSGLLYTKRFRIEGTKILEVPITDAHVPNLQVAVTLIGAAPDPNLVAPPKPAPPQRRAHAWKIEGPTIATNRITLRVPPYQRTLMVTAEPRNRFVEPGAETTIDLSVRDAAGQPVPKAEVCVMVVDEAVLALTQYQTPDPLTAFYHRRYPRVSEMHLRYYAPADSQDLLREKMEELLLEMDGGGPVGSVRKRPSRRRKARVIRLHSIAIEGETIGRAIELRTDFSPLALFSPTTLTDETGRAEIPIDLPDNVTRYRVMAAVAHENHFGSAASTLTAKKPLMLRPSPPRFLNYGDRMALPILLQNQTPHDLSATVAVRASNMILESDRGSRVLVPAHDRALIQIPARAVQAGTALFQVAAAAGPMTDATQFTFPVWAPATTEAVATYGEIDSGAILQPIALPKEVAPDFGGLEVTISATQLQALTDALLYLVRYPFECSEQLSSRVVSVVALVDVLQAFKAEGLPSKEEIKRFIDQDIEKLQQRQNSDGGWSFWTRGGWSNPFLTAHVMHALVRAKAKGFTVPHRMLRNGHNYLRSIDYHLNSRKIWPAAKRSIVAYALFVRSMMGDLDVSRASALIEEAGGVDKLPLESIGWLVSIFADADPSQITEIRRVINNRVTETAATAHFATSYEEDAYLLLHSDRRADAIILEQLIRDQPKSPLIPKLVRGLLAHRTKGRWANTQESAWVLLALDRYFQTYEKATPDFVARAWLGDAFVGEQPFRGRTIDRQHLLIPMKEITNSQDLLLAKEGQGRLYYRIGLSYAPSDLALDRSDHGFAVRRTYESVSAKDDVRRDADGTWRIKAGALVRVRLSMVAPARRYYVALVDPLPAGLEALNPELAATPAIPVDEQDRGRWWERSWYEHQNMRDERVEAFTTVLWPGSYRFDYTARATTEGRFIVPPTKAEQMYFPETFGRSESATVIVE